jgi:hypothetical protein
MGGALLALPGSAALIARLTRDNPAPLVGFRALPGELPQDGRPHVAGIRLPLGRRWAPLEAEPSDVVAWGTDEGVEGIFELASQLAYAFSETGLWPVLWLDPDRAASYCGTPGRMSAVDAAKTERVLADEWSRRLSGSDAAEPFRSRFPGLARSTSAHSVVDPFRLLEARQHLNDQWDVDSADARLLLVPCARPADVVARIGLICGTAYSGVEDPALVSSVLRSWERRFDAVLVALAPRAVILAVGGPPTDLDNALKIAAEHRAFATANSFDPLADRARQLLTTDIWDLAWDE